MLFRSKLSSSRGNKPLIGLIISLLKEGFTIKDLYNFYIRKKTKTSKTTLTNITKRPKASRYYGDKSKFNRKDIIDFITYFEYII